MRKARIENGVVVDIVDIYSIHEDFAHLYSVECGGNVQIGSLYKNGEFAPPPIASLEIPVLGGSSGVPYSITPRIEAWQARDILEVMGLTAQIEASLSASDPLIAARYKAFTVFDRYNALIVMFASQLGFTDAQTDSMFIVANQITSTSTRADIEALLRAEGLIP